MAKLKLSRYSLSKKISKSPIKDKKPSTVSKNPFMMNENMIRSIPKNSIHSTDIEEYHRLEAHTNSRKIFSIIMIYPKLPSRSGSVAPKNKVFSTQILQQSSSKMTLKHKNCVITIWDTHCKVRKKTAKS